MYIYNIHILRYILLDLDISISDSFGSTEGGNQHYFGKGISARVTSSPRLKNSSLKKTKTQHTRPRISEFGVSLTTNEESLDLSDDGDSPIFDRKKLKGKNKFKAISEKVGRQQSMMSAISSSMGGKSSMMSKKRDMGNSNP